MTTDPIVGRSYYVGKRVAKIISRHLSDRDEDAWTVRYEDNGLFGFVRTEHIGYEAGPKALRDKFRF